MKLDVNVLRYLSKEDFRVLTSVEMGQKNHELVPMQLIDSISGLKHGGAYRCLKTLLQHKLVHHEGHKYDGYRLTYMGYDFLAIKTLVARGHISGVGRQIGVGKESDIFEVTNDEGEVFALKLHRLGRTSFRDVKSKRDYLGTRSNYSWLYLSRLAALKEFAFMKALGDHGFPVPVAIDNNRHAVLMELVDGQPLVQIRELGNPAKVYNHCMDLIYKLATRGLIHCDFNEFNLLISEDEELTLIDFPQMVSVSHPNADELFERDVECIIRFFNKKIGYMPQLDETLESYRPSFEAAVAEAAAAGASGLDVELAASGFSKQNQKDLESFIHDDDNDTEINSEDGSELQDGESEEGVDSEVHSSEHANETADCSSSPAAAAADHVVEYLQQQLASLNTAAAGSSNSSSRRVGQVAASTHQWLEQHAADAAGAAAVAAAAAAASGSAAGSSSEAEDAGDTDEALATAAAGQQQQQQQQQQGWEQGSVAPSRAPTDINFMSREVQQRLVAQRQKASARTATAKATRNVSKAKGKKAKKTAAAMADW